MEKKEEKRKIVQLTLLLSISANSWQLYVFLNAFLQIFRPIFLKFMAKFYVHYLIHNLNIFD